ncbi:MAG: protocatechuate 3,4-dioxygenase [Alphaproteobacteria bacterium]
MAEIVLGIGTSHGPMLTTPADKWDLRVPSDHASKHYFRGKVWSYDQLIDLRRAENLGAQATEEMWRVRHDACHRAINRLADAFEAAKVDIAVIVGNDQMEIFDESLLPALSVFVGAEIVSTPYGAEKLEHMPPGIAIAMPGYTPDGGAVYPGAPALGQQILRKAVAAGYDPVAIKSMPKGMTPHAFGYVYRQIMRDRPPPSVPVMLNTFYPPNQPSARRCFELGGVLVDAIQSWDTPARVALVASGGLTHFVIDEELDNHFIDAIRARRVDWMADVGEEIYQEGTSELKNWIPVASAMAQLGFEPDVVDYVPCYRTEAGTGNAMGFISWSKDEGAARA